MLQKGDLGKKLYWIDPRNYAKSGSVDARPVFVSLLKAVNPRGNERADEARGVTETIAATLGRPQKQVHLRYLPAAAGRQAFGGRLLPDAENV